MNVRASGSSLRRGGHKPLHMDELPVRLERAKWIRINAGNEVHASSTSIIKWKKRFTEGFAIIGNADGELAKLPLESQTHKGAKAVLDFLRQRSRSPLHMRYEEA